MWKKCPSPEDKKKLLRVLFWAIFQCKRRLPNGIRECEEIHRRLCRELFSQDTEALWDVSTIEQRWIRRFGSTAAAVTTNPPPAPQPSPARRTGPVRLSGMHDVLSNARLARRALEKVQTALQDAEITGGALDGSSLAESSQNVLASIAAMTAVDNRLEQAYRTLLEEVDAVYRTVFCGLTVQMTVLKSQLRRIRHP